MKKKKWHPKKQPKLSKAKKLEVPPPLRPAASALHSTYRGLITADASQTDAALRAALHWYDKLVAFISFRGPLSPGALAVRSESIDARALGINSSGVGDKIDYYKLAILSMEQFAQETGVQVPKIAKYLKEGEHKQTRIASIDQQLSNKYASILTLLVEALQPLTYDQRDVKIKIGTIKDPILLDPEAALIILRKDVAKKFSVILRHKGLLALFIEVIEPFSRLAAMFPARTLVGDKEGRYHTDREKQIVAIGSMLRTFAKYCMSEKAPKRLAKAEVIRMPSPSSNKGKGGFGQREKETITGLYAVNGGMGKLVIALGDGLWHEVAALATLIAPTSLESRLEALKRQGRAWDDKWLIEYQGDKVRMIFPEKDSA